MFLTKLKISCGIVAVPPVEVGVSFSFGELSSESAAAAAADEENVTTVAEQLRRR